MLTASTTRFNADEVEDRGMALGLLLHACTRIDKKDRNIGVGRTRRHVARVLLVTRAVDEYEPARFGIEVLPCDIDRDALLTLGD